MTENSEITNPQDYLPEYETDLSAVGTNRKAAPPDGKDQDWTELHPNGSAAWLRGEIK